MSDDLVIWQSGFVKGFKLKAFDDHLFSNILGFYENKQVEFCIKEKMKKVSGATHGYYRGVLLPVAAENELFGGWTITEIHDYFAEKYLSDVKEKIMGQDVIIVKRILSTRDISQKTMNHFIQQVRQELEENNIHTPEPIKQKEHDN